MKLTNPWPLVIPSVNHVSWNLAATSIPPTGRSLSENSVNRAPKVIEVPLSTTVCIIGVLSVNRVTPLTRIEALPVPVR